MMIDRYKFYAVDIRKIFYLDRTTLGYSDPQIKQIACQFPLSTLIQAESTVDQPDHPRFI